MIRYTFGEFIEKLKGKKKLSTADIIKLLADSGVDRATYFRLAKAKGLSDFNATLKLIDRICLGLDVKPDSVFEYKTEGSNKK